MSIETVLFWALAAVSIATGWRVFVTDSMVRASFLLLVSFIAVGGLMLMLGAPYLGIATIFMMAVEMMIMALFMVMFMMNPAGLNPMSMVHQPRLAAGAGVTTFGALALVPVLFDFEPRDPPAGAEAVVVALGHELLGDSMLIFESAGIMLLATMVGAIVLSSRRGRFGDADEGASPPVLEPSAQHERPAATKGNHARSDDDGDVAPPLESRR